VRAAAQDLYENLTQGFSQYLQYRLGEDAFEQTIREIGEIKKVCAAAENAGAEIQLVPTAYDPLKRTARTKPIV
jgi:hypothetical protein